MDLWGMPKTYEVAIHKYMEVGKDGKKVFGARTEIKIHFGNEVIVNKNNAQLLIDGKRIEFGSLHPSPSARFSKDDAANADDNIKDAAAGRPRKTSPYSDVGETNVYLSDALIDGLTSFAKDYTLSISELTGAKHSATSRHYVGVAVDITSINGVPVTKDNPHFKALMEKVKELGAIEVIGPGSKGHDTHVHLAWARDKQKKVEAAEPEVKK